MIHKVLHQLLLKYEVREHKQTYIRSANGMSNRMNNFTSSLSLVKCSHQLPHDDVPKSPRFINKVCGDGNGYPQPETRWVFTLLGYGYGSIYVPTDLLMGKKLYPLGLRVRVRS
jgi:hypothetical protein